MTLRRKPKGFSRADLNKCEPPAGIITLPEAFFLPLFSS